jgi:hypothetical protein
MKINRGTLNQETGLVFAGYGKSYLNGEWWVTPEKYAARKEKQAAYAKKAYKSSEEKRNRVLSQNKKWRSGKGLEWVRRYDTSEERLKKKRERAFELYQTCTEYRQNALNKNKKHRNTEHAKRRESAYKSRPERLAKRRFRLAKRKETDLGFVLKTRIRARLQKAIKINGIKTSQTLSKYCGASINTLKSFIEAQFVDGMSWKNRDKWHVDHFFPMAIADDEKTLRMVSFFTNLRPMWAAENCSKNAKLPSLQEIIERDRFVENWIMNTQNLEK